MTLFPWNDPFVHAAVLAAAIAIDRWIGEPPNRWHPVVWVGRVIGWARDSAPSGVAARFAWGTAMAVAIPAGAATVLSAPVLVPYIGSGLAVFVVTSCFAIRGLVDAGHRLATCAGSGGLSDARASLSWLCSRDPSRLDVAQLTAAATESVAENASDSLVAPLFWYAVAGIPGLVVYRVVNTMDAMVGYRGRYEWLGKPAARLDDVLNLVPARLTALLLLLASAASRQGDVARGWRVLRSDAGKTASPNAGWPMAVTAGILGVELAKESHYVLGRGLASSTPASLREACSLTELAMTGSAVGLVAVWLGVGLTGVG